MIIKYFFPRFVILGNWVDNFHLMKSNWKTFFSHVIMPAAKVTMGPNLLWSFIPICICLICQDRFLLRKDYIWWKYLVKSLKTRLFEKPSRKRSFDVWPNLIPFVSFNFSAKTLWMALKHIKSCFFNLDYETSNKVGFTVFKSFFYKIWKRIVG